VAAVIRALLTATLFVVPIACDTGTSVRAQMPADSAAGEIPFRMAGLGGAALVVPVYMNGKGPYDLVFDTGATFTCVDKTLVQELNLPSRKGAVAFGAGATGSGRVQLVTIDSIRVGGVRGSDVTACVLDLAHLGKISPNVRGLLGLNFIRNFRVSLDFKRNIVQLSAP
jgi:predicted aspartyl protease